MRTLIIFFVLACAGTAFAQTPPIITQMGGTGISVKNDTLLADTLIHIAGGGSGSVTAVSSGNFSPLFNVSISNPTTTPAFSFSGISQSQNLFFASPNGSSGVGAYRSIVAADVPTLNQNTTGTAASFTGNLTGDVTSSGMTTSYGNTVPVGKGGTGVVNPTVNDLLVGNGSSAMTVLSTANMGVLATNGSGVPSITTTPQLGVVSTSTGSIALANSSSANLTTLQGGNATAALTYILPTAAPASSSYVLGVGGTTSPIQLTWVAGGGGGGSGTVTNFTAGNLSPLFTTSVATSTTTPALTFSLSNVNPAKFLAGPDTSSSSSGAAAPTYRSIGVMDLPNGLWQYKASYQYHYTFGSGDPANPDPVPGTGWGDVAIGQCAANTSSNNHVIVLGESVNNGSQGSGPSLGEASFTCNTALINIFENPVGAKGTNSFAFGYGAAVYGNRSTSLAGYSNNVFGDEAGAFAGQNNLDSGFYSAVIGGYGDTILYDKYLDPSSGPVGTHMGAVALGGLHVMVADSNQVGMGQYNTVDHAAFFIGNGTAWNSRSDLYEIMPNGSILVKGTTVLNSSQIVPAGAGGTGVATGTAHSIPFFEGTNAFNNSGAGTAGQLMTSGGGSADGAYTSLIGGTSITIHAGASGDTVIYSGAGGGMANPMTTTGDIIYSSDNSGTPARLGIGTAYQVLGDSSGIPKWETLLTNSTLSGNGLNPSLGINLGTSNIWTGSITQNESNIGATYTNALVLTNSTLASSGTPVQQSGSMLWQGTVRNSTTTIDTVAIRMTMVPTNNGGFNDNPILNFAAQNANSGSFTNIVQFLGAGSSSGHAHINEVDASGSYQVGGLDYLYGPGGAGAVGYSLQVGDNGLPIGMTGAGNCGIGHYVLNAVTSGAYNTAVGCGVESVYGGPLTGVTTGQFNTAVGYGSGKSMTTHNSGTFIGYKAGGSITGANNTTLGYEAGINQTTGTYNLLLGADAGTNSSATETQTAEFGGNVTAGTDNITDFYFGDGSVAATSSNADNVHLHASGGNGTNKTGGHLYLDGGKGTGNAASGAVIFEGSPATSTGTTLQTLGEVARFDTSGLRMASGTTINARSVIASGMMNAAAGLQMQYRIGSGPTDNVVTTDIIIGCPSGAAQTEVMPLDANVTVGQVFIFKDKDGTAGTHNITINMNGSDSGVTFDGASSLTIVNNYQAIRIIKSATKTYLTW